MNFIDGLNGLSSGVTFITCVFLSIFAAYANAGSPISRRRCWPRHPRLPAFNFPRARIFMGDVGSQFCGFVLAMLAVTSSRFEGADLSFVLVPMMLAGVLYDVAFTLIRRLLRARTFTQAPSRPSVPGRPSRGARPAADHPDLLGLHPVRRRRRLVLPRRASLYKPLIVPVPLIPPLVWTAYVIHRGRVMQVGRWSR